MTSLFPVKFLFLIFGTFVSCQVTTKFPPGTNVPNVCLCAPAGQCDLAGGGGETDGSDVLHARILNTGGINKTSTGTKKPLCLPASTGIPLASEAVETCDNPLGMCCPEVGYTCGVSYPPVEGAPQPGPGQASYGSYSFQVSFYSANKKYLGSGSIIDQLHVLTTAHILQNQALPLTVKIGYWDLSLTQEILERMDMISSSVTIHPNFNRRNLKNNIAIVRLPSAVPLGRTPNIGSICLPNAPVEGIRCLVSGWGKGNFSEPENIMKEVDVPLVSGPACQDSLRKTNLSRTFKLDTDSFICAGGEAGKDSCFGDGGSPLSCYIVDRFYLVGMVSWGIGCGAQGVPAAYTNVFKFVPWIQSTIAQLGRQGPPPLPVTTARATTTSTIGSTTTSTPAATTSTTTRPVIATTTTTTTTTTTRTAASTAAPATSTVTTTSRPTNPPTTTGTTAVPTTLPRLPGNPTTTTPGLPGTPTGGPRTGTRSGSRPTRTGTGRTSTTLQDGNADESGTTTPLVRRTRTASGQRPNGTGSTAKVTPSFTLTRSTSQGLGWGK